MLCRCELINLFILDGICEGVNDVKERVLKLLSKSKENRLDESLTKLRSQSYSSYSNLSNDETIPFVAQYFLHLTE